MPASVHNKELLFRRIALSGTHALPVRAFHFREGEGWVRAFTPFTADNRSTEHFYSRAFVMQRVSRAM